MDIIFKTKMIQAKKRSQNSINNLIFHSLIALTFTLLCSYPYWLPSINKFLFQSLPNILSSFSSPKCLFIVVNIIVVFLVVESKLVGYSQPSSKSSPYSEIYEEYVDRSRRSRVRRASIINHDGPEEKEEAMLDVNWSEEIADKEVIKEEDNELIVNELISNCEKENEAEVQKELEQDQEYQEQKVQKEKDKGYEDKEESKTSMLLPTDELNRRVEEFIAMVNKQRWLEANPLTVCCEA